MKKVRKAGMTTDGEEEKGTVNPQRTKFPESRGVFCGCR